MDKWLKLLLLSTIILSGCAHTYKKPPVNDPSDDANIRLAEAATSISQSMLEMARVDKIVTPRHLGNNLNIPTTYNLQTRASIDWTGPIEELTDRIAKAANYRLRVLGKEPSVPVLISVNVKDASLVEILRDIDYQAGKKAHLHVYPNNQVVELRYVKLYS